MKNTLITEILQQMNSVLDNAQMMQLRKVLEHSFYTYEVSQKENGTEDNDKQNQEYLELFLAAKHIEGCSDKHSKNGK